MGCEVFNIYGVHGDCANCPYDCDEKVDEYYGYGLGEEADDE